MTAYHTKDFAHELTKRCPSDSVGKLAASLADAQLDLNPHQIDWDLVIIDETDRLRNLYKPTNKIANAIKPQHLIFQGWDGHCPTHGFRVEA